MQTITSDKAEQIFQEASQYPVVSEAGFETVEGGFTHNKTQIANITELCNICHEAAASRGWWHQRAPSDITNDDSLVYILKQRNFGEMIALIHSEISEALEAARKDLMSDHIPEFTGVEEELADTLIRIFDLAGAAQLRLGEAFVAKMKYNANREDHSLKAREAEGGKKI